MVAFSKGNDKKLLCLDFKELNEIEKTKIKKNYLVGKKSWLI